MNGKKATMNVCCFRTFGLIVGWVAMLLPVQAYALSLGGFQVESALDEPLRAEIQLQSVDAGTLESLEVTLGSEEDFRRADVPRSEFLQNLEFTVTGTDDGNAIVEVSSEQPMKEPFLHFLVSVEWSGGKLVREYTGLLDPPLYADDSPSGVESPSVGSSATAQAEEPAMSEPAEAQASGSVSSTSGTVSGAAEYGPTGEGDTLWDIAARLNTGEVRANIFQIMIALQRQNPDAFIDNNVNRLKTGQVLRLDDIAAVAQISAEQASIEYTAQLEEWQTATGAQVASATDTDDDAAAADSAAATTADEGAETGAADASEAGQAAADTTAAASAETSPQEAGASAQGQDDVLRIVQATVDESEQSETASAGADRAGELAEMQGQIATLQETLESRNLENAELRERVRLLESQLENAQRLIEIESQELAAAQQQAAEAQAQAAQAQQEAQQAQAADEAVESETASASDQVSAQSVQPVEEASQESEASAEPVEPSAAEGESQTAAADTQQSQSQSGESQQASAAATSTGQSAGQSDAQSGEGTEKVRTVSSRPPQASWWSQLPDMLFSSWMWMVGAGIGVLVLVLGLLMFLRRRQSIAEFEESILSGSALDSYSETTDNAATSASDTSFLSDFGTAGMGTMQADEVDPLAEAEVYLAYGRDEQAEEVLKEAARRDPGRSEVKLKLLEIYKQRNDIKSFETIAEELYPAGDSGDIEVWNQVCTMGRELNPGNPLFQESAPGGGDTGGAAAATAGAAGAAAAGGDDSDLMNFNLDDLGAANESPEPSQAAASASPAPSTGGELDFDLDSEMTTTQDEQPAAAPPAAAQRDESMLDFGGDFLEQPTGNVDPATQPFPAPDQQTDLDRELERLAGEREATTATSTDAPAGGAIGTEEVDETPAPSQEADWEKADSDAGTLDFPASDTSEIDFDLNLDESSIQQLSASDTQEPAAEALRDNGDASTAEDSEAVLEFESENIPPEETWAGPSSDTAPVAADNDVAYSPEDDVQAAGAPQYNEAETKLDLARAYLDMGDKVGARSIIDEVMREGDPAQRDQAAQLAAQL